MDPKDDTATSVSLVLPSDGDTYMESQEKKNENLNWKDVLALPGESSYPSKYEVSSVLQTSSTFVASTRSSPSIADSSAENCLQPFHTGRKHAGDSGAFQSAFDSNSDSSVFSNKSKNNSKLNASKKCGFSSRPHRKSLEACDQFELSFDSSTESVTMIMRNQDSFESSDIFKVPFITVKDAPADHIEAIDETLEGFGNAGDHSAVSANTIAASSQVESTSNTNANATDSNNTIKSGRNATSVHLVNADSLDSDQTNTLLDCVNKTSCSKIADYQLSNCTCTADSNSAAKSDGRATSTLSINGDSLDFEQTNNSLDCVHKSSFSKNVEHQPNCNYIKSPVQIFKKVSYLDITSVNSDVIDMNTSQQKSISKNHESLEGSCCKNKTNANESTTENIGEPFPLSTLCRSSRRLRTSAQRMLNASLQSQKTLMEETSVVKTLQQTINGGQPSPMNGENDFTPSKVGDTTKMSTKSEISHIIDQTEIDKLVNNSTCLAGSNLCGKVLTRCSKRGLNESENSFGENTVSSVRDYDNISFHCTNQSTAKKQNRTTMPPPTSKLASRGQCKRKPTQLPHSVVEKKIVKNMKLQEENTHRKSNGHSKDRQKSKMSTEALKHQQLLSPTGAKPKLLICGEPYCNRALMKPTKWANADLYKFVIDKLYMEFNIRSRVEAEKFVIFLCDKCKEICRMESDFSKPANELILQMARLHLVKTELDFHRFVFKYLPIEVYKKTVPCIGIFGHPPLVPWVEGSQFGKIVFKNM